MQTVETIENRLFQLAPKAGAMDWDNVGLLVGDPAQAVTRVLVALDITEPVVREAISLGAQLIVAHHPVMNCTWLPVQTLREDTPQGHLLRSLVRSDISAICMHTNLDVASGGVNDALLDALKLVDPGPLAPDGLGRVGTVPDGPLPLGEYAKRVSEQLHCNGVRYADAGIPVHRVAVGGGACAEYAAEARSLGCDTFVTADLKYHDFLNAVPQGINLIDAGHFPTENVVCAVLIKTLQDTFPDLTIQKSTSLEEVIQYDVKGDS
ncbi:MAG: Nif3-like dinuclear metal center hexameric protein [Oscillibacter sp.]|nr:Nif3-like dinuclear metal center hexameric protein [Oscillibacter sp.]